MSETNLKDMQDLVSLCKRRGFIFQSSEIYGGLASCWDYGPLGVELKQNIKNTWWKAMTLRDDVVGVDASIFMHPTVWQASGHVECFNDPMVDCKQCKSRFRADKIDLAKACPVCGSSGTFTEPRDFNLMFKTQMGPVEDSSSQVYLRPETAQGIFVNFLNVQQTMRKKLPFGISQIGKAFRIEITPGNFIFRTREFEQMEMQYFIKPGTEMEWYRYWKETRMKWHLALGTSESSLRYHDHDNLAHYANAAVDIQFEFPFGFKELEGIHSRTDFDLNSHQELSGKKLQYFDPETNESYVPYVVETSIGLDRMFLSMLSSAYTEENVPDADGKDSTRVVLKFHPALAPVKCAILPLLKNNDDLTAMGRKIFDELKYHFLCQYDEKDAIGRRYRRQDAIGTPFCVTVDHQSLEDQTVTIRERDTLQQERVHMSEIRKIVEGRLEFPLVAK